MMQIIELFIGVLRFADFPFILLGPGPHLLLLLAGLGCLLQQRRQILLDLLILVPILLILAQERGDLIGLQLLPQGQILLGCRCLLGQRFDSEVSSSRISCTRFKLLTSSASCFSAASLRLLYFTMPAASSKITRRSCGLLLSS